MACGSRERIHVLPGRRVSVREGPATTNSQAGGWPGQRPAVGVRVGTAGPESAGPSRPRREAPVRTSGNALRGTALVGTTLSWG